MASSSARTTRSPRPYGKPLAEAARAFSAQLNRRPNFCAFNRQNRKHLYYAVEAFNHDWALRLTSKHCMCVQHPHAVHVYIFYSSGTYRWKS